MGFQNFGNFRSRHPAIRTTGLLTFALAGLSPAEHTSVSWSPPSDMLAVRIGQLTAEVFHLLDLQPCWLLLPLADMILSAQFVSRAKINARSRDTGNEPKACLPRLRGGAVRLSGVLDFEGALADDPLMDVAKALYYLSE